jgi:hypothetical protein
MYGFSANPEFLTPFWAEIRRAPLIKAPRLNLRDAYILAPEGPRSLGFPVKPYLHRTGTRFFKVKTLYGLNCKNLHFGVHFENSI